MKLEKGSKSSIEADGEERRGGSVEIKIDKETRRSIETEEEKGGKKLNGGGWRKERGLHGG